MPNLKDDKCTDHFYAAVQFVCTETLSKIITVLYLQSFVEDVGANLNHLQVLFLFISGTFDVSHPAALFLLTGINETPDSPVLIEHLNTHSQEN